MKGWFVIFSIALLSRCCNSNCPRRHLHSFVCIVHWLSYTKCCLFIFVLSIFVLHLLFTIPSYMFLILLLLSLLSSYFSVSSVPPNFPPTLPSCVINPFWARLFNLNYYLMFTPDPKQNCSHNLKKPLCKSHSYSNSYSPWTIPSSKPSLTSTHPLSQTCVWRPGEVAFPQAALSSTT